MLLIGATTACGVIQMKTLTIEQATQRLDRYLQDATAAIATAAPGVRFEEQGRAIIGPCGPPTGTGPRGQEFADYGGFLRGVSAAQNADVYAALEGYWADHDWTVYADRRPDFNSIYARSPDSYEMVIQTSSDPSRTVSLGGSSPCVWPDGTPPG